MPDPGRIVILNGAPRAGKSSIVAAIQAGFEGVWMNLGVDLWVQATPPAFRPGLGLRPGGERPDLEPLVAVSYAALYESVAAHSRLGLNVVIDVGHHDPAVLADCARRLSGLPVLFVGVRCPIETIMARRNAGADGLYAKGTAEEPVPAPVRRWQDGVHRPGIYDLEVDTSTMSPSACAEAIGRLLKEGIPAPTAFERLSWKPHAPEETS
ncbi:chloramphenicol phosphotransferase [bacterium]|nr:MAG: chloramphenicol phosphotransferase [bacterium]